MTVDFKRISDYEVVSEDGGRVRLGSLWADQTAILAFVRHFG